MFTFDCHSCPKYSNFDFQALKSLTKIKPSYKANIAKYCKTYQNKNLDKTRKRQGQKAIYKGIPQKLWHREAWRAAKKRLGKKKIGKRKQGNRNSWNTINRPKSRIYQYSIIGIQTETKFGSLKMAGKALPNKF